MDQTHRLTIRLARAEDREPVLAFCARIYEEGDYIQDAWDYWLQDTEGQLLVAVLDELPVGIVHMQMLNTAEAWLEGLRVDPEYQRRGIASTLDRHAMHEARLRGATYIRLMIGSTNEASIRFIEKLSMRRVGSCVLYQSTALTTSPKRPVSERPRLATLEDLEDCIYYLNHSNIFPLVGGLYFSAYAAYQITAELLQEKITAGQLFLLRRWGRIDGLAIAEPDEEYLSLGYIDGTTIEAVSFIAHDLRQRLPDMGLSTIRVYAPELVMIYDAFTGTGYSPDDFTFYVYERILQ